jgi:eukaryotic-like serine/threonine-protein kinase
VHRDVKPQNLLLRNDGTLKVADFGIARAAETTVLTQVGTVLGTAAYLSPEQALGQEVTASADVYSLGAVVYELLAGQPPYEFDSLADLASKQAKGTITPLSELAPDVPPRVEDAVMRTLAVNPADRPASAEAFAAELGPGGFEPPTVPLTAPTTVAPAPHRSRPVRVRLVLAGVLVFAGGLLALAVGTRGGGSPTPKPPPPAAVKPIQPGATAREQARNIGAWLRRNSR